MKSTILDLVHQTLLQSPECREYDSTLVFTVWKSELLHQHGININTLTLTDIDQLTIQKKVSTYDTITRLSRLVKKTYPELKGKRKRKTEEEVTEEILVYKKELFE